MPELVIFDHFAENECRYFRPEWDVNNGYGCAHPKQANVDGMELANGRTVVRGRCYFFSCPLGVSVSPHAEPLDADMLRRMGEDPDEYGDGELILLFRKRRRQRQPGRRGMSVLDGLLGKGGAPPRCKIVSKDIAVHWFTAFEDGAPCLCGATTYTPELFDDDRDDQPATPDHA